MQFLRCSFMLRQVKLWGVGLLVGMAFVACSGSSPTPQPTSTSGGLLFGVAKPTDVRSVYSLPPDQTLIRLGSESNNPRSYDPATSSGSKLLYSGLVNFDTHMVIKPDLAESWDIDKTRTIYTFHLRHNVTFHNGHAFTAQDVIYSWERAANSELHSDTVLTYLGDIIGIKDRFAGKATNVAGLKAIDDYTLQVTIDAPKPYFLMKLTYGPALIVDKNTVESGPDWYRRPNGTGPYKLMKWNTNEVQIYERYDGFYLPLPAIRYIVYKLFAGVGVRLYESGQIDLAGVNINEVDRIADPDEPLHNELLQGVSACTVYVIVDVTQSPFDDIKVRQAFALAINRQQYVDLVYRGHAVPAKGLYPPALPGYSLNLRPLDYDPKLAQQRLAESRYAGNLPPIVLTTSGFGSEISPADQALVGMWQNTLGVSIHIINVESDHFIDQVHSGHHGQLTLYAWCADYLDPENFADALFHSNTPGNIGHYTNTDLDTILDKARTETDINKRIQLYQQAEQTIVDDVPAIFLLYPMQFVLVKPFVTGYELTPVNISLERYLGIDLLRARRHEN